MGWHHVANFQCVTFLCGRFAPANSKVTPSADPNFGAALAEIDFAAVKQSIKNMLVVPQDDIWPADYDHYGPFMIRLAWYLPCVLSYQDVIFALSQALRWFLPCI